VAVTAWSIRSMRPQDRTAVLEIAGSLRKWFTPQGLDEIRADLESHAGYLAEREHRPLGFVTWTDIDGDTANLSWMGVIEDWQHRGIGTSLLAVLVAELRRRGYRFLQVSTVAESVVYEPYAETRRFYRARGFRDYRVDEKYFGEGDNRYDRLLMRLDLSSPGRDRSG